MSFRIQNQKIIVLLFFLFPFSGLAHAQSSQNNVPPTEYLITVHSDLGMHCTGFDLSYCCILPPYNSILAQIIKTSGGPSEKPVILTEADLSAQNRILWY